jgi:hypothetical protein
MATENDYAKIRRNLEYLREDMRNMPQYLKGPFRLLHDCVLELDEIVSRLDGAKGESKNLDKWLRP